MRTLVWVRRDVRVADNTALYNASRRSSNGVVCLFVCSPGDWQRHDDAPVKIDLWLRSLGEMSSDLAQLNIPLLVRTAPTPGDIPGLITKVARAAAADSVFVNTEYEVNEARRDTEVAAACRKAGIGFESFHDQVVIAPQDIRTQTDRPYSVFTPFKKAWIAELDRRGGVQVLPPPEKQQPLGISSDAVPAAASFGLTTTVEQSLWPAGEAAAAKRLASFCQASIARYKAERDAPALSGTSVLSPYLAIGAISPRACIAAAVRLNDGKLASTKEGPSNWISEVIWREFYRHIIVHFPRVSMGRAFKPSTDKLPWSYDQKHLDAWAAGRTGYPIVDAGMRQLAATGWMHNRVRMIVAMFLTKDLFIDWRLGERHFMRTLIDGDLAQNNGGWQWSASTGTDAAPYFRIYNPINQSQTHDPDGNYIRRWVPELKDATAEQIHDPATLPMLLRLKTDYPQPIVDRTKTRERVMKAFQSIGEPKA